jgi:hypothetical protein
MENMNQFMSDLDWFLLRFLWLVLVIAGGYLFWKVLPELDVIDDHFAGVKKRPPPEDDSETGDIDFSRDVPPPDSPRSQERPKEFYLGALHRHNKN